MASRSRPSDTDRWAALRNRNYRLYFGGQIISQTGSWLQRVAQAWLVLELGATPVQLGLVTVFQFLPVMLLTLFAGVLVDRFPKRRMLMVIQCCAAVQATAMAILALSGVIQLWQVYAMALIYGVIDAFEKPTRQTYVSELVPREAVRSAVSLNSTVMNTARLIGPSLAGVLIVVLGTGWCFALNAVSYLGTIGALLLMHVDPALVKRGAARGAVLGQLLDGLRYSLREPNLVMPLCLIAVVGTLGYNFLVALPLLARDAFGVGAVEFGLMNAAIGAGAITGALLIASRVAPTHRRLALAALAFGVLLLLAATSPWYPLTLVFLGAMGIAGVVLSTGTNTTLQLGSRDEYRGRVLSLYLLLFAGTTPIGGAITGALATATNIRVALSIEAVSCILAALGGLAYLRRAMAQREALVPATAEPPGAAS